MRHHAPLAHRFPVCIHCQRRLHRRNCCSRRWLTTASRSTRGWVSSPPPTPSVALAPSVPSIYRTVAPWCSYYSVGSSSTHTGVCLLQLGIRPQGISSVLSIFLLPASRRSRGPSSLFYQPCTPSRSHNRIPQYCTASYLPAVHRLWYFSTVISLWCRFSNPCNYDCIPV